MTYRIVRVARLGRPLTRAVYLGTVEAESEVDAINRFLGLQTYYRVAADLAAEPASRTAA